MNTETAITVSPVVLLREHFKWSHIQICQDPPTHPPFTTLLWLRVLPDSLLSFVSNQSGTFRGSKEDIELKKGGETKVRPMDSDNDENKSMTIKKAVALFVHANLHRIVWNGERYTCRVLCKGERLAGEILTEPVVALFHGKGELFKTFTIEEFVRLYHVTDQVGPQP